MREQEIKKYKTLNSISEQDGIVIFGSKEDIYIPLCELKQAFGIKENCYNRSFENLTISEACEIYADCVADLSPETILLHIEDAESFKTSADKFTADYRKLISQIRKNNKKCEYFALFSLFSFQNCQCFNMLCLWEHVIRLN